MGFSKPGKIVIAAHHDDSIAADHDSIMSAGKDIIKRIVINFVIFIVNYLRILKSRLKKSQGSVNKLTINYSYNAGDI